FHYPRDDWPGANYHEGDWEGVTVFVHRASPSDQWAPLAMGFAQHLRCDFSSDWWADGGMFLPWGAVEVEPGSMRPHVYVGLGGHASYANSGTTCWPTLNPFGFFENAEYHDGSVKVANAAVVPLRRFSEISPDDATWEWLTYPGHWGLPMGSAFYYDGP